ncbi:MAG: AAA family ATPase [Phycisphaerales bacterium]
MNAALRVSLRTLRACAAFGLAPHAADQPPERALVERLAGLVSPTSRMLITGASGSGKTRLARAVASALHARGMRVVRADPARGSPRSNEGILDVLPGPLPFACSLLARVGLADATLLTRRVGELSEGEGFRLLLARALSRGPDVLVADEFCSALDSRLARNLTLSICSRAGCALVLVTAREEVARWVRADVVVTCTRGESPRTEILS